MHRTLQYVLIQPFFIEHHVGLDDAAAVAAGDSVGFPDDPGSLQTVKALASAHTAVLIDGAVEIENHLAAGLFVETVYILGDDGSELALLLQL